MPRRNRHNPNADELPRVDHGDADADDVGKWISVDECRRLELRALLAERKAEDERRLEIAGGYGDHYQEYLDQSAELRTPGWRPGNDVSSTEVAGILVANLLRREKIRSNVNAWIAGHELTRRRNALDFPTYATEKLGFQPKAQFKDDWRGTYSMAGIRYRVALKHNKVEPCITVRISGGKRLVIFFAGGSTIDSGRDEYAILLELLDRAAIWRHRSNDDVYAVAVPRSAAFQRAIIWARDSIGVASVGINFLTVERAVCEVKGLDDLAGPLRAGRGRPAGGEASRARARQ
jgi:hypothetical protein